MPEVQLNTSLGSGVRFGRFCSVRPLSGWGERFGLVSLVRFGLLSCCFNRFTSCGREEPRLGGGGVRFHRFGLVKMLFGGVVRFHSLLGSVRSNFLWEVLEGGVRFHRLGRKGKLGQNRPDF